MSGLNPDFLFVGPGRTGSTWLYECLVDHPDILMTEEKVVNYYDRKYHKGVKWFRDQYPHRSDEAVVGTVSTSYISTPGVPERIASHVPDATLLFCLRNPMERAYSHWWHLKQVGVINYDFEDAFEVDTPYVIYLLPGLYHLHLQRYRKYFDDDQLEFLFFEDLVQDNEAYIANVYDRIGVDAEHVPGQAGNRVKEAEQGIHPRYKRVVQWMSSTTPGPIKSVTGPLRRRARRVVESKTEYEQGMDPNVREECESIFAADVCQLSAEVDRDLSHWFEYVDVDF